MKVAVMGYGTVGSGVVEVIADNQELIAKRTGETVEVKYILDIRDFPGDRFEDKIVHDVNLIMDDSEVGVVCEVMGGVGVAYQFTKMALERGKSVCTSNKELVAKHGPELLQIAAANHCSYLFEASVGGGIPIIRPLNNALTAERIEMITGILNGTTNYILTKMEKEGADFADVLKEAQEKGYAERNPEADIEGHDACRKISILSSLMTGKTVDSEKVYTEGITKVTAADFVYAKAMGRSIKLLGMSCDQGDEVQVMVAPCMISNKNPLYMVSDVFNAILVRGNMLGDSMYYGRGAGKLPTASAVVADVIDCVKNAGKNIPCLWSAEEAKIADPAEVERVFFLRVNAVGLDAVKAAFPDGEVIAVDGREDTGYVTELVKEKDFAARCEALGAVVLSKIRMGE